MSTNQAATQDDRAAQAAKRRKRKERAAKARAPEPKDIVSGAGQPLDLSVRRELEEQLGHDFSQVRLHTDHDAGRLTEMLGADAVAVGQDIFFREGTYRPGTTDGQRLLAHELLHTVQNPHGLGALRAGRDLGAVSLPQQAAEREAEAGAQELVRAEEPARAEPPQIEAGHVSPGWMRYATVDADRMRVEQLDPETVVDRLVNGVLRSLRGDPADTSGRVRLQLVKMGPELQEAVLDQLEVRLPTPEHDRLIDLVDEADQVLLPYDASSAPHGVADAVEELELERRSDEDAWRARLEQGKQLEDERIRAAQRRKAEDPGADDRAAEEDRKSGGDRESEGGTGQGAAGAAAPGRPGEQTEQDSAEANPLQREGTSGGAERSPEGGQGPGAAGEGKGGAQSAESARAQGSAQPRRGEDERKESSARQAGTVARPAPVDKSAADRGGTGSPALEPDAASDQGPDDEELEADEGGESEALADLEELLAGAETEEEADAEADSAHESDPLGPDTLESNTDGATLAPPSTKDGQNGAPGRPPEPRMSADDAEALASSLDEMDEEEEAEAEPEPAETAQALDGDRDVQDTDDAAQTKGEAVDRNLASGQDASPSGADGERAGADGATTSGKLAKAEDDARGQAAPTGGSGGAAGGGAGTAEPVRGRTSAQPGAASAAAVNAASAGPVPAARPPAGGDTGVTPAAEEVRSKVPSTEALPKHERAGSDDDRPVAVKSTPRSRRSGGGGGGGGGVGRGPGRAAATPKKASPAPNVSAATPEAGLAAASNLKPHLALTTLKGVDAAVGRSVSEERGELKDAPPTLERPVGSPTTVRGGPKPATPGSYTTQRVGKDAPAQGNTPEIKGEKTPSGELPGGDMKEPSWWDIGKTIAFALGKKLLSKLLPLDKLMGSMDDMPTSDKGLQGAKVGDAPKLPLKDDSDPQRTDEQAKKLDEKGVELQVSGRDDAARPMGEDQIYPDVPKETLTAKIGGGKRKGGHGGGPAGVPGAGLPAEAVSTVAEHEQGPQIKQAYGQARQQMTTARKEKDTKAGRDRRQYQRDVKREIDSNTKEQASARNRGRSEIARSRTGWRKEQDDKLSEIDGKKGKQFTKARKDIKEKQDTTDKDVDKRTTDDQKKIDDQRTGAEKEVVQKRDDGKKDSRNWFEKGLDWIKEQFNKLKKAIKDVFEKARNLVKGVIEEFKKQVFKFIDDARKWVIGKINEFADALIRLGDELLKDYPAMRDKWRKSINGLRDAAIKKVNDAADKLKKIAGKLIDAFGDMLLAGLDILEKGLLIAVSVAETVTVKAMEVGAAILKGLGEWAAIATDILSDPGGWIGKAKDAAVTGAKEHLFTEIKAAVKEWFNQKVQQLIGIPMEMFNRLLKGGTSKEEMAKMAWDAALPQLPLIIGELIVTKVVAKLIPGAGWVMAIIDALKTAYDALGAVLRAFGMFMTFLKSVKSGNGALPFAKAVASGVVALLELIYQWLVSGVGKYLGKVAKVLRGRAAKLGKKHDEPGTKRDPKDPKKDTKDPKKEPSKDPKADPEKDAPRHEDPAKRPDRPSAKDEGDDDRDPNVRPRPQPAGHPGPKRPDGRGPGSDRPDSRRPGGQRPDGKRPTDQRPGDKRPDLTQPKNKRPDARTPAKRGRRPNKDAPGQKRKPTSKQRKKPSLLSRVGDGVRNALAKLRKALRRLGNKARSLLNKLKYFAGRVKDLWRRVKDRMRRERDRRRTEDQTRGPEREPEMPTAPFADELHHRHILKYRGRGKGAALMVRSNPTEIRAYLDKWNTQIDDIEDARERQSQRAAHGNAEKAFILVRRAQLRLPPARPAGRRPSSPSLATGEQQAAYDVLGIQLGRLARALEQRKGGAEPPLLPMIIPKFSDGVRGASFKATGINKSVKHGEEASILDSGVDDIPLGWGPRTRNRKPRWGRTHLLTAQLSGKVQGSNLVPTTTTLNTRFLNEVEKHAKQAIKGVPQQEKMIWYKVQVSFQSDDRRDPNYGFPKSLGMSWGGYDVKNESWREKPSTKSYSRSGLLLPEASSTDPNFSINDRSASTISKELKVSAGFAEVVHRLSPFSNMRTFIMRMNNHMLTLSSQQAAEFNRDLQKVISQSSAIRFT